MKEGVAYFKDLWNLDEDIRMDHLPTIFPCI